MPLTRYQAMRNALNWLEQTLSEEMLVDEMAAAGDDAEESDVFQDDFGPLMRKQKGGAPSSELPLKTARELSLKTAGELPLKTSGELPLKTPGELPLKTSDELPLKTSDELPLKTAGEAGRSEEPEKEGDRTVETRETTEEAGVPVREHPASVQQRKEAAELLYISIERLLLLGVTDVWSQIRNFTINSLATLITRFTFEQLERFCASLILVSAPLPYCPIS